MTDKPKVYSAHDSFEDYVGNPGLNQTRLRLMQKSPKHFKADLDKKATPSLTMGRLGHLCVLQYDLFDDLVVIWTGGMTTGKDPRPTTNKNSKAYKEFKYAHEQQGHVIVDQAELDACHSVRNAVLEHPTASMLLSGGESELSIYWNHEDVFCKARIDYLNQGIIDLKLLRDLAPDKVARAVLDYGYHHQAAFYQDAVLALTGEKRPYSIVACEKVEPFDVVVYEVDDAILDLGRQEYRRCIERYLECLERDYWPGISEVSTKLELPNWAYADLEEPVKLTMAGKEFKV